MIKYLPRITAIVFITASVIGCSANTTNIQDEYKGKTEDNVYSQAKDNLKNGRYTQAIKDFEALEARFPYGQYSDQALLDLAYAHFKKNDHTSALIEVDRYLKLYPKHKDVDYALYLKGLINYESNFSNVYKYLPLDRSKRESTQAKQSFDDFKVLLERFPNSKYAPDAKKRMIVLKDQLAWHELHIAKHYYEKGAYLAAANRANYIINKFEKTKAVPDALVIMINSYHKLGMQELENDARQVLELNYPDKKINDLS